MTMKQVDPGVEMAPAPVLDVVGLPNDLMAAVKFTLPTDEDMTAVAALRASSEPWKSRGETQEDSLKALTQLKPFIHVGRLQSQIVGYVTVERDGPVPGAAYLRNIVVKPELRKKGLGMVVLDRRSGPRGTCTARPSPCAWTRPTRPRWASTARRASPPWPRWCPRSPASCGC